MAIEDVNQGGESRLSEEDMRSTSAIFKNMQREKVLADARLKNIELGEAFMRENAKNQSVKVTDSGIQYEVLVPGSGASPTAEDAVTVHYHGTLIDGRVFDSSLGESRTSKFSS